MTKRTKRLLFLISPFFVLTICFLIFRNNLDGAQIHLQGFSKENIPCLNVFMGTEKITVKLDLGYQGYISLPKQTLQKANKTSSQGTKYCYGITGKTYPVSIYHLENIAIGKISFFNIEAEENNNDFEADSHLDSSHDEPELGRIGWLLFQNKKLLLDCKNQRMIICDNLSYLKELENPFQIEAETPLFINKGRLEFEAKSDDQIIRCLLDTGTTFNLLNTTSNPTLPFSPEKNPDNKNLFVLQKNKKVFHSFSLGNKDFGPISFRAIKTPLPIEAVIGMDFFEKQPVLIDFVAKKIFFLKPNLSENHRDLFQTSKEFPYREDKDC